MTAPIAVRVTRYQDPWCGRTHSSRRRAVEHMARCWRNPDVRGCKTCRHFIQDPGEADVGLMGGEWCDRGVDLGGRKACTSCFGGKVGGIEFDTDQTVCTDCNGDHAEVKAGPIVHCDLWEASDADH